MNAGPVIINGLHYGNVSKVGSGFVFIPATDAHRTSRKVHATPEACLPRYVRLALAKLEGNKVS